MPHHEQITIAPGLTFDALAADKPGAPLGLLHDAAAAVGSGRPRRSPLSPRWQTGATALAGRLPCRRHCMVN